MKACPYPCIGYMPHVHACAAVVRDHVGHDGWEGFVDVTLHRGCQMLLVEFTGQQACWPCVRFRRLISRTGWDRCDFVVVFDQASLEPKLCLVAEAALPSSPAQQQAEGCSCPARQQINPGVLTSAVHFRS